MITKVIAEALRNLADRVEAGECGEISTEDLYTICDVISTLDSSQRVSKEEACNYLHMSRSTFDSWVSLGVIPKGEKRLGFKELSWKRGDLDVAKDKIANMKDK